MSIGLGKVEKLILKALKKYGGLSITDLALVKEHGLDFWTEEKQEEIGSFWLPSRSSAIWQSMARAVRRLARKGLVKCIKRPNSSGYKREFTEVSIR